MFWHALIDALQSVVFVEKIVSELIATAINGKSAMPTQTFSSSEAYFDADHSRFKEKNWCKS